MSGPVLQSRGLQVGDPAGLFYVSEGTPFEGHFAGLLAVALAAVCQLYEQLAIIAANAVFIKIVGSEINGYSVISAELDLLLGGKHEDD